VYGNDYFWVIAALWGICENTRDALIAACGGSSRTAAAMVAGPRGRPGSPESTGTMNGTVLYIEDNQDNVFLLQRLLQRRRPDIQLHTAMTGRDGIKAAIDDQPALILLDNRLPDTDGEQVLLQLAAVPASAAIPVVILSGDSNPVTVNELLAAGAVDFLVKPFDIHQLLAIIGRYLP
jgi:CheY-like chemotaxis protein